MEFYHGKEHDMWMKGCIPLGKFITESEHKLDLGVWLNPSNGNPSFAIVYGDEGSQYVSGSFRMYESGVPKQQDYFNETIKRYNEYLNNKGENNGKSYTKEQN